MWILFIPTEVVNHILLDDDAISFALSAVIAIFGSGGIRLSLRKRRHSKEEADNEAGYSVALEMSHVWIL